MNKYILLLSIIITFSAGLFSQPVNKIIYISPSGNDAAAGTKEQPLASLNGAWDRIISLNNQQQLKDTVYVRVQPGDYYMEKPFVVNSENVTLPECQVVFMGDNMNKPVFNGGIPAGKFEKVRDNLWKVYIPEVVRYGLSFEQLYVNNQRRFRAQFPNRGEFLSIKKVEETVLDSTGITKGGDAHWAFPWSLQKIYPEQVDKNVLNALGGIDENEVVATFYHKWDVTRKRIQRINEKDTILYFTGKKMQPWNKIDEKSYFILENYFQALDAPGEWFLDRKSGYLYYIPYPGETIENTSCLIPTINSFIRIEGSNKNLVKNIKFENICFHATSYNTPYTGDEPVQAAATVDASVRIDFAQNIGFFNCEIAHTGQHAIWLRRACSDCKVEHCHLYDLGGGGIKIGETVLSPESDEISKRNTIDNNIIQHGGFTFPSSAGVLILHSSDNNITHNDIADFRYTGISVGWVWGYTPSPSKRNKIEFNHIHYLGWGELSDMGGIYTLGLSEGTTIKNNHIHHVFSRTYGGWGIYTDEGSTGITIENNLAYKCKSSGFHQHYGSNNRIQNNIFALNIDGQLQATRIEDHTSFSFTNNIVYYDQGDLFASNWDKIRINTDFNCYWDTRTKDIKVKEMPFKQWQKQGKDVHSIIADPGFTDAKSSDFRFKNKNILSRIHFTPFDYSKAGVYGSPEWVNKAKVDPALAESFEKVILKGTK